jgi:hypothetical protein
MKAKRRELQDRLEKKRIDISKLNDSIRSLRNMQIGTEKQLE